MKNNYFFKRMLILFVGTTILLAFSGSCPAEDSIKIGIAGVHTGDLAPFGISIVRGVELAVSEVNRKSGVLGKKIELFVVDDYCQPKEAAAKALKLVENNVHAVIGHTCSGATLAAMDIYLDAGVIVISPSATNPVLTHSGRFPNFFRTIARDDAQAKVQVEFAINSLKIKKFALLHDKSVYGKGLADYVREFLQKSGQAEVVLFDGISPTSISYSEIVQKIRATGAKAVIYGGYHPGAIKIITNMHRLKMDVVFISGDGVKDNIFIKSAGKNTEGVYATAPRDASRNYLAVAALQAYVKKYKSPPGQFFLNAYAATMALCNAIERAGTTDYKAVAKALKAGFVETPIGKIGFNIQGDATGVGFSVYQVKNGVFIEIVKQGQW